MKRKIFLDQKRNMAECVEGEFKNFIFRMVQPSDYPMIEQHLKDNFYKDEPISVLSEYDEEMGDESNQLILEGIKKDSRLSFVVLDKNTGKLAGVRLTTWEKKSEKDDEAPVAPQHTRMIPIAMLLMKLNEEADIYGRYPNVKEYADFTLVSVGREYRGSGLASEIYKRSLTMLEALKLPLIKCIFTNPITQNIARKCGFKEICTIQLNEWKNESGEPAWPKAKDEESAILMVKELSALKN